MASFQTKAVLVESPEAKDLPVSGLPGTLFIREGEKTIQFFGEGSRIPLRLDLSGVKGMLKKGAKLKLRLTDDRNGPGHVFTILDDSRQPSVEQREEVRGRLLRLLNARHADVPQGMDVLATFHERSRAAEKGKRLGERALKPAKPGSERSETQLARETLLERDEELRASYNYHVLEQGAAEEAFWRLHRDAVEKERLRLTVGVLSSALENPTRPTKQTDAKVTYELSHDKQTQVFLNEPVIKAAYDRFVRSGRMQREAFWEKYVDSRIRREEHERRRLRDDVLAGHKRKAKRKEEGEEGARDPIGADPETFFHEYAEGRVSSDPPELRRELREAVEQNVDPQVNLLLSEFDSLKPRRKGRGGYGTLEPVRVYEPDDVRESTTEAAAHVTLRSHDAEEVAHVINRFGSRVLNFHRESQAARAEEAGMRGEELGDLRASPAAAFVPLPPSAARDVGVLNRQDEEEGGGGRGRKRGRAREALEAAMEEGALNAFLARPALARSKAATTATFNATMPMLKLAHELQDRTPRDRHGFPEFLPPDSRLWFRQVANQNHMQLSVLWAALTVSNGDDPQDLVKIKENLERRIGEMHSLMPPEQAEEESAVLVEQRRILRSMLPPLQRGLEELNRVMEGGRASKSRRLT